MNTYEMPTDENKRPTHVSDDIISHGTHDRLTM